MDLVDRYLQAVKFWLPKKQKQDIIAELSEDLRSQIEDRESELGRKLNESEIVTLLKQRGRPVLVANRFLPQESLIGPVLFPIYLFVLKIVAAFYMVPWTLVWIGLAISRAAHSGQSLIPTIGLFWTSFWPVALFWVGGVTIVFGILERVQAKSGFLEEWDPRKLPPVRDPNRITRANSIVEVVANMVFCIWLIGGMWYQTVLHFSGVTITLAPTWRYFFWGFLLMGVGNMVASAVNLFRPYWTWVRATIRLVSDCVGSVFFCWLMKANIIAAISVVNVASEKTAQVAQAINWWSAKMFPFRNSCVRDYCCD
jgi:MFS family permease